MFIYLAGPFFNGSQVATNVNAERALRGNASVKEVFVPRREEDAIIDTSVVKDLNDDALRSQIFNNDLQALAKANAIVVMSDYVYMSQLDRMRFKLNDLHFMDPGTAFEMGYAYAHSIPIVVVDSEKEQTARSGARMNLMIDNPDVIVVSNFDELREFDFGSLAMDE